MEATQCQDDNTVDSLLAHIWTTHMLAFSRSRRDDSPSLLPMTGGLRLSLCGAISGEDGRDALLLPHTPGQMLLLFSWTRTHSLYTCFSLAALQVLSLLCHAHHTLLLLVCHTENLLQQHFLHFLRKCILCVSSCCSCLSGVTVLHAWDNLLKGCGPKAT